MSGICSCAHRDFILGYPGRFLSGTGRFGNRLWTERNYAYAAMGILLVMYVPGRKAEPAPHTIRQCRGYNHLTPSGNTPSFRYQKPSSSMITGTGHTLIASGQGHRNNRDDTVPGGLSFSLLFLMMPEENHMIPYQNTCIRFMKTAEQFSYIKVNNPGSCLPGVSVSPVV